MRLILIIFLTFATIQTETYDISAEVSNLNKDISYGNGCVLSGSLPSNWVSNEDVHLNGHSIKANGSKITINADVYIEGGELIANSCEYSEIIVNGQIIN